MNFNILQFALLAASLVLNGCSNDPNESADASSQQEPVEHKLPPAAVKNLLLICIDTVRADVFFGMGQAREDAFSIWKDRALVFEQATSTSSWTVPTLGSVFSGLWPPEHGAGQFPGVISEFGAEFPTAMFKNVPVLAEVAKQQKFSTAIVSASAWTNTKLTSLGLIDGFDKVIAVETGWRQLLTQLEDVLEQQTEGVPSFNFLHLLEAHNWHLETELELDARIDKFSAQERALFLKIAPARACKDEQSLLCKRYLVYASAVSSVREAIAITLEMMQERNLLDDTAVIVFSDHGEDFGDHSDDTRLITKLHNVSDRYVGHGHSMYQEVLHVPLLVWHPRLEGAVISNPVSLVDIAPTAARWLGVEFAPARWPGRYLDDYLQPSLELTERVVYSSGIATGEQQVGIRQGSKKSIFYMVSDQTDYYDLGEDPHELHTSPTSALVMSFDAQLLDYVQAMPQKTPEKGKLSDEQIKRLQSIGYLQGLEVGEDATAE